MFEFNNGAENEQKGYYRPERSLKILKKTIVWHIFEQCTMMSGSLEVKLTALKNTIKQESC